MVWNLLSWADRYLPLSSLFSNRCNAILNYHSVSTVDSGLPYEVSIERFRRDMEYLVEHFVIVDLPELLADRTSGEKRIAITFDDGFENFYSNALPVLREFDAQATVFVNPSFIGDSNVEQIKSRHFLERAPSPIMMNWSQLSSLTNSEIVTIGNHTLTHRNLSTVQNRDVLEEEIIGAKRQLENELGIEVNRFSYPYGQYNESTLDIVRDYHAFGVGTSWGLLTESCERHRMPRVGAHTPKQMVHWELTDLSHKIRIAGNRFSL